MAMEEISAYYQCYKNKKALDYVLSKFRQVYPESKLILVSDGGLDFSELSKKYNCDFFYEEKLDTKSNLVFNNLKSIENFIERIAKYSKIINSKYLLLLEDDVIVFKKTNTQELIYDINGCNKNEFLNLKIQQILKNNNPELSNKFYFGACGGSIINLDFFKNVFENKVKLILDTQEFFYNSQPFECASDRLLSFLCYKNKGSIGQYKGFCETWQEDYKIRKNNNTIEILHQYKDLYE